MPVAAPDPLFEVINTTRPDLANTISQIHKRIQRRTDKVTLEALMHDPEWKRNLLEALPPNIGADDKSSVVGGVAVYRDRWGINDSPLPLGPVPAEYEWERKSQTVSVQRLIDGARRTAATSPQPGMWIDEPPTREASLMNVGWQL
jgi:hypothetical protein